jgi:hypothetical protein
MSRAEMTRSKAPRTVNMTVSSRRWSVRPKAAYRGSRWECPESGATMNGRLKKTPSASARVTLCKSQFLSALPVSHSNPTQRASSSGNSFTSCILLPYTLAASSTAVSRDLAMKFGLPPDKIQFDEVGFCWVKRQAHAVGLKTRSPQLEEAMPFLVPCAATPADVQPKAR